MDTGTKYRILRMVFITIMIKMFLTENISTENVTALVNDVYHTFSESLPENEIIKLAGGESKEEMEASNRSGTMEDTKSRILNLSKLSHGIQRDLFVDDDPHNSEVTRGNGSKLERISEEQFKLFTSENVDGSLNSTLLYKDGSVISNQHDDEFNTTVNWHIFQSERFNDVRLTDPINIYQNSPIDNKTKVAEIQSTQTDWGNYMEREARNVYSRYSLNSFEVKVEFLRLNYAQFLKMILTSEHVESRQILPNPAGVSETCYSHMMDWFDSLAGQVDDHNRLNYKSQRWALKMFDSFGRPSAGLITGALQLEGDYDQCLDIKVNIPAGTRLIGGRVKTEPTEFVTRYCRVEIPVGPDYTLGLPRDVNTFWTEKQSFYLNFNWGICVPKKCHSDDVRSFLNNGSLRSLHLNVTRVTCFNEPSLLDDPGAIVTVLLLVLFLALVTGCSVLDVYRLHGPCVLWHNKGDKPEHDKKNKNIQLSHFCNEAFEMDIPSPDVVGQVETNQTVNQNSTPHNDMLDNSRSCEQSASKLNKTKTQADVLIHRISFYSNFLRLINTDNSKETFTCIQGMKVISMAWIVAGHCYTYGGLLDEANIIFKNTAELVIRSSSLTFHLVGSAHLAVDTFFVISGFLVMIITLRTMENKSKPLFWLTFFLHRFWRLTPMYMMVLAVGTNLYDHIVRGPLKADNFEEFEECKDKWWSHLLYINNFYRPDKKCMTWSWYMSVDMQLYFISPVFIYATFRNRKFGVLLLSGLCITGIVSAFIAEFVNGGQFVLMDLRFLEYWSYVYSMPYTRVSAYAIGMLLAVFLYYNHEGLSLTTPVVIILWLISLSLGIFLVLINHIQWKMNSELWSPWQQSMYEALARPTWALCIAWVIYACNTGHGGVANSILSWKPFLVLSRLTYAVYLLHPLVILFVIYSRRSAIYLHPAYMSMVYNYIGNITLSYLLAVIFSLTFEVPMLALERLVLKRH